MTELVRAIAYIMHPPWAKWAQRCLLVAIYAVMGLLGFAMLGQPQPIEGAGWVVMAGALIALCGVATRLYRIEAIGLWPQITGLGLVVIWLQLPVQGRAVNGWLVAGYALLLGLRLLELNLIAWRARKEAEAGDDT
jgi:hypothetical protein